MKLRDLCTVLPDVDPDALPDIEVVGVQDDSRSISTGDVFIARAGANVDGANYAEDARRRGAVAVIAAKQIDLGGAIPVIITGHAAAAAGLLAQRLQGDPSQQLSVLGVTGTNGKTTTTYLLRHLLAQAGQACGLIGTCVTHDGVRERIANMTTPGPVETSTLLAGMRDKGCTAAAMEVSSHALDQQRTAGLRFAGAAFTNLTGDHLDYHGTLENYAAAKARLFEQLPAGVPAVVNAQDPAADRMIRDTAGRVVRFAVNGQADYAATDITMDATGCRFTLTTPAGTVQASTKLVGRHNVENALAAVALAGETFGLSAEALVEALADAPAAPGRLEPVHDGGPVAVLVDYAHTDDALENVLLALRPITKGRLKVVFGCGGDRDRTKRPRMARVAERLADDLFVTSDNPRTEDPATIIRDIKAGLTKRAHVDIDRRQSIRAAIESAQPGDCVLVAGKGHEDYQIIGTTKHTFDDRIECRRVLAERTMAEAS